MAAMSRSARPCRVPRRDRGELAGVLAHELAVDGGALTAGRQRPPHTYQQVKYAVDHSTQVTTDYLTRHSRNGGPSILQKIAAAWRGLTAGGDPVELALVTNRAPD